ncbi:MAG TPA: hypothetical protein PK379_08380 [Candidatus Hydrogenedentes bacterium]|nr:hypothetical protein [Candidatus Hydrogenedentota bacterium]
MSDIPGPEMNPDARVITVSPVAKRWPLRGMLLMLLAAAILGVCGETERRWLDSVPWSRAAVLVNAPESRDDPASGCIPVRVLRLTAETLEKVLSPAEFALLRHPELSDATDAPAPTFDPPWLIILDAEPRVLAALVASGYTPDSAKPEVLAGELISPSCDTVNIHGTPCAVSGRLRGGIPAFSWAFVALDGEGIAPVTRQCPEVWSGYLDPKGLDRLAEAADESSPEEPLAGTGQDLPGDVPSTAGVNLRSWDGPFLSDAKPAAATDPGNIGLPGTGADEENASFWIADPCRTRPAITLVGLVGLFLSFLGGALLQRDLLNRLAETARPEQFFYPFLRETRRYTRLWNWLHGVYYSWVLVCMLAAIMMPALGLFLLNAVQHVFSEGDLAYVGAAYESGSILHAAWATFYNNYIIQTVRNTILFSIFGFPVGVFVVFSALFSTALVMSPVWTRMVSGYALHSITMSLELQAYLLAVFAVLCWSRWVLRFLFRPSRFSLAGMTFGFRSLAGATLFIGVQLAFAALYESITLLIFM